MPRHRNVTQILAVKMGGFIKYSRDRGDRLPVELVTAPMKEAPRPILQDSLDLLLPTVIQECDLGEEWENNGIIRSVNIRWLQDGKFVLPSITVALKREQREQVVIACPKISEEYITSGVQSAVEKIIKAAQDYVDGKFAQLTLDDAKPQENMPELQKPEDEVTQKRRAKARKA